VLLLLWLLLWLVLWLLADWVQCTGTSKDGSGRVALFQVGLGTLWCTAHALC
jgi:hypothetical protein